VPDTHHAPTHTPPTSFLVLVIYSPAQFRLKFSQSPITLPFTGFCPGNWNRDGSPAPALNLESLPIWVLRRLQSSPLTQSLHPQDERHTKPSPFYLRFHGHSGLYDVVLHPIPPKGDFLCPFEGFRPSPHHRPQPLHPSPFHRRVDRPASLQEMTPPPKTQPTSTNPDIPPAWLF